MIAMVLAAALASANVSDEYWVCTYLGYASKQNQPIAVTYLLRSGKLYEGLDGIEDFAEYKIILNSPQILFGALPPFGKTADNAYITTIFINKKSRDLIVTFQNMSDRSVKYRVGECAAPIKR